MTTPALLFQIQDIVGQRSEPHRPGEIACRLSRACTCYLSLGHTTEVFEMNPYNAITTLKCGVEQENKCRSPPARPSDRHQDTQIADGAPAVAHERAHDDERDYSFPYRGAQMEAPPVFGRLYSAHFNLGHVLASLPRGDPPVSGVGD